MERVILKSRRRGSSLVEFALGFGVLWMLFTGVYQFGYSFYLYNKLITAVSGGARFASTLTYDTAHPDVYIAAVRNMVVYGDPANPPAAGAQPVVLGLSPSDINVNVNPQDKVPTDVTITVSKVDLVTIFKTFSLANKPRVTAVYLGNVICGAC